MWPWGHAAVAYLAYRLAIPLVPGASARIDRRRIHGAPLLALAAGTALPDVVDKPLAWTLAVLPTGRSLAHSLVTAAVVVAAVVWVARRRNRVPEAGAFALGWVVHSLSDGVAAVVAGDWGGLSYLLWPVFPSPAYETDQSFLAHLRDLSLTTGVAVELALVAVAGAVFLATEYRRRR